MRKSIMKKYAQAVVKFGANVKKGQYVVINADVRQAEFTKYLTEECYKAKARFVRVKYSNDAIDKLGIQNVKYDTYMENADLREAELKMAADKLPVMIHVMDGDPDVFNGLDMSENTKARIAMYPMMKPYLDKMDNKYQWVICAMPSIDWAKKVFPNDKPKDAFKKLEDAILKTTRIDAHATANWKAHVATLQEKAAKMNELNLDYIEYKSSNGTDLKLHLMKNHNWLSAREKVMGKNREFTANMPTEEVFTMPDPYKVDGIVYSTKPLSLRGKLIDNFSVKFKDGKVVEIKASNNQDVLEGLIKEDEASSRLGEVALVPYDSPINQSGILFYNTLFDENAACHLALGASFKNCVKDYEKITEEQWKEMKFNDSMNHVDFMIGSKDLDIVGTTFDGKKVQIFSNGNWVI